jgi:hypothetical protein
VPTPFGTPSFGISQAEAIELYNTLYMPAHTTSHGFTGDIPTCNAGTISDGRKDALLRQINYYRQMAGVRPVTLDASMNDKVQRAVLVIAANQELTHDLDPSWPCYSSSASEGALHSNLGFQTDDFCHRLDEEGSNCLEWWYTSSIEASMVDSGSNNTRVGHRNWLLNPLQRQMGVGEFLDRGFNVGGEFVLDPDINYRESKWPDTRHGLLAWPPPGYVPFEVAYRKWSFHLQGGRFENAVVRVWMDGAPVNVSIIYAAGDDNLEGNARHSPLIVFAPAIDWFELGKTTPRFVRVEIENVRIQGKGDGHSFAYEMLFFAP